MNLPKYNTKIDFDTWNVISSLFQTGRTQQGTVIDKIGDVFLISFPYGVEGISSEDLNIDETSDFEITFLDKTSRMLIVNKLTKTERQ